MDTAAALLAANLRRYRVAAGLSQEALAHAANLHVNAIGLLERGQRDPRLSTLRALAQALTAASEQPVSVADLIAGIK